jgi:hypothetical protein
MKSRAQRARQQDAEHGKVSAQMFDRKRQMDADGTGTMATERISLQEGVDLLAHVPMFSELRQRELRELRNLANAAMQREYPACTAIVRQGETGTSLYIPLSGCTLVSQRLPDGLLEADVSGGFFASVTMIMAVGQKSRLPRTGTPAGDTLPQTKASAPP